MAAPLRAEAAVAVIGAGAMGAGIAQVAAQAGHRVLLFDARTGAADDAADPGKLAATFESLASKGRMTVDEARAAAGRIVAVHTPAACVSARGSSSRRSSGPDVKRLFDDLERVVAADAILASNTRRCRSPRSRRHEASGPCNGLHFSTRRPDAARRDRARTRYRSRRRRSLFATAAAWGKTPVHATSTPGFIVNRCARPFYAEALRLAAERAADCATIDAVMREAGGFRMGPFS